MTAPAPLLTDHQKVAFFKRRCLDDTGFVCRNILGWNFDEYGGKRTNVGTGGVRAKGAHQRIVEFLDREDTRYKLLEAPRGSYKSTIIQGFITRQILKNPNVRILYGMKTDEKVAEKSLAIRNSLEMPLVRDLFGEQRGELWDNQKFIVAGRTKKNLQEATVSTFSLKALPTGGHYEFIIVDDLIDHENCKTPESLENAKRVAELIQPLLIAGGTLIYIGTRYDEGDIYAELESNPLFRPPYGETVIYGAGVRVRQKDGGGLFLELDESTGGLTFPHLTLELLTERLHGMSRKGDFFTFSCQYLNYVPTGTTAFFKREQFQPLRWGEDMRGLSGYLLTDTATSEKEEGCYSVIAYVLLDVHDNLYLVDLRVGHWRPQQFIEVFFEVLDLWATGDKAANHCGECWEEISLAEVFEAAIKNDARARRIRLHPIKMPRKKTNDKFARIGRLETPLAKGQFYVVNTVPRTFEDLDGERILWDPEGHTDARSNTKLPGGELVDEFVRFPSTKWKRDIPDTLAMAYEVRVADGYRYVKHRPLRAVSLRTPTLTELRAPRQPDDDRPDYWSTTLKELGF